MKSRKYVGKMASWNKSLVSRRVWRTEVKLFEGSLVITGRRRISLQLCWRPFDYYGVWKYETKFFLLKLGYMNIGRFKNQRIVKFPPGMKKRTI